MSIVSSINFDEIRKNLFTIDFYWDEGGFITVLFNKTDKSIDEIVKIIKKKLKEYKEDNEDYNDADWTDYLDSMNEIEVITTINYYGKHVETSADYYIYF